MIAKFSDMSKSIFTKVILSITALSFVSLFGVSGYINTANRNKVVIKVDDIEISQSEFNYELQKQWAKLRVLLGDEMSEELADEKKTLLAADLAQYKLNNAILDNTMRKNNIDFSQNLVLNIIMVSPQFQQNGVFNPQAFKQYLQQSGIGENEYITDLKRSIARKILLETQVAGFNVSETALKQMQKVWGQRRTFKYAEIKYGDAKITRLPSQEELDQYYNDFKDEFVVTEERDVKLMFLSFDALASSLKISDEEVNEYYNEHIEDYEQPEKRKVLQMIFNSEQEASAAAEEVRNGADFAKVAAQSGQNDVDLGFVAADDLLSELSDVAFSLRKGQTSAPFELNEEWQVLKVEDIQPASKVNRAKAEEEIRQALRQERAYNQSYEIVNAIEDKLGAGDELEDIAAEYKTALIEVKNISEKGTSDSRNVDVIALLENKDVIDAVFSYNEGEASGVIEDDNGLAVVKVEKIIEEHVQPQEEVTDKIKTLWAENERASIVQEKVDNVEHDIDAGDTLNEVAARYRLPVKRSMPIDRNENFADLSATDINELFTLPKGETKIIKRGDDYVVVYSDEIYDDSASLSEQDKNIIKQSLYAENIGELANALLKDFARDYEIEVNYNRMGIED